MALCCLLLLTKSPTTTSFQSSSTLTARDPVSRIGKISLGATREPPPTTQSDNKSDIPIKDVDGSNADDDGISDEDKMKIPLMGIDADEDIVEKTISDGSDLPGSADAFDYAWDRSSQAFLDWTSGTSIGSFLLQRQREEENAAIVRGVDSQTGQAEYSTDLGGNGGSSSSPPRAKESSEQLVRDQSRRMEGRKRRKERRKERMVEAQLEELREQQRTRQQQVGGVQIIDDTATSGVGKQIIDDEKNSAADASRRRRRRKDDGDMEDRKSRARLWRRKKRDRSKARQKAFDVDRVRRDYMVPQRLIVSYLWCLPLLTFLHSSFRFLPGM